MPRGRLRVYLGVAPGAGKTHALVDEARRCGARGKDVVVAAVDTRGRLPLDVACAGLERVGDGRQVDVEAVLARRPAVAVVDDLQEPNSPGARHPYRWQDVEELIAAGVDVVAAVDVRYLASLVDVVEVLTGSRPPHVVPDRVLRDADQLQLVDIAPPALRRRLAHGRLHPAEQVDAELSAVYRPPVLAALRELAFTWMLGTVVHQHAGDAAGGPTVPTVAAGVRQAEVHERVLVALPGGPQTEPLLRRAARMAARMPGAELHAVHVLSGRSLPGREEQDTGVLRALAADVGATYQQVIGDDVAVALLAVAEAEHATQLVVGADTPCGRLGRLARAFGRRGGGITARLVSAAPHLDIHVAAVPVGGQHVEMPPSRPGLPRWRRLTGLAVAVVLPVALAVGLVRAGSWTGLAGDSLLFLLAVVITSLVGGLVPALLGAVIGSTLLNFYFIPPVHTLRVAEPHNIFTLVVFVLVAAMVSGVVQRAATLSTKAARASAESRALASMAGSVLRGQEGLPTLLEHVRTAFGMTSASLLEHVPTASDTGTGSSWRAVNACGQEPPARPEEADVTVPAGDNLVLALSGRTLAAADRTMVGAFAAQAQGLLERDRLARAAALAARLEATERLRDALLAAVGHDLRTPLASARAAVSSLQAADVTWSGQERQELLATAEESLERLGRLVTDLLDLSRLRAGVLTVVGEPVWLDDVIPPALDELGEPGRDVTLRIRDDLPPVLADAALLTRALVNVIGNALRHAPGDSAPVLTASHRADHVEIRVIDRGPGIPEQDRERVFVPFQRLGDTDNFTGLGLGLALSRGLVEAMNGTLEPEDTPGGGLTMVLSLPTALDDGNRTAEPGRRERKEE